MSSSRECDDREVTPIKARSVILVVDDDEDILSMVKARLQLRNYLVVTANSTTNGISVSRDLHVDAVISDLAMPDISGEELIQETRQASILAHMPIIAFSSKNKRLEELFGADYFVLKWDPQDLETELSHIFENVNSTKGLLESILQRFSH